jgi:hypothetical protein
LTCWSNGSSRSKPMKMGSAARMYTSASTVSPSHTCEGVRARGRGMG